MKCKKIFINILESKDTIQEINDKITNDLQGYHIVLENKTFDCFICDFEQISENDVFWSIDMKKTIKKCTCFKYNSYKCSIEIKKKEKIDLIIWIEENNEFELKSINAITLKAGKTVDESAQIVKTIILKVLLNNG